MAWRNRRLPVKDGAPDSGTLEKRACNPAGRFITCLGARDPLGGVVRKRLAFVKGCFLLAKPAHVLPDAKPTD